MGIFDFLKKSAASGEPLLAMEPQSVRYTWFTMQLPAGWQFTRADNRSFALSGPGRCSVEVKFMQPRGFAMTEFDRHREFIVKAMQGFLESPSGKETKLMTGVMWMEAIDVQERAQRLRMALFNTRPRDLNEYPPPSD